MKPVILHIAAHYGGGIGAVFINYLRHAVHGKYEHRVICLERPTDELMTVCNRLGVKLHVGKIGYWDIWADLVVIHWWNRDSINKVIASGWFKRDKVIIWSHVSGLYKPHKFTKKLLNYPDQFVFTTPLSLGHPAVSTMKIAPRVIWSTRGVDKFLKLKSKPHKGFIIGYVGTVDYKKMHPKFLEICSKIKIPGVKFIVCGGQREKELVKENQGGIRNLWATGIVKNISPYLQRCDVFGYPLRRDHFGTCEQAIGEAMAAGLPSVVLSNPSEWHIIDHNVTGIITSNPEAYIHAMWRLYKSPKLRRTLGMQARIAAKYKYSTSRMVNDWEELITEVLCK
jgi:glycosyltransferase involved in cell wall biosynthesis